MLIGSRAIQGCGSSGLINGALSIIASAAPMERRPMLIGIIQAMASIGSVIGPTIGGALTQYVSWRWAFHTVNLAALVVFPIVAFIRVPERPGKVYLTSWGPREIIDRLDLIGWCLLSPPIIMLLLAVFWGGVETYAWDSSVVIGLICGAAVGFAVFCFWQHWRGDKALISIGLLRMKVVTCASATAFFQMGPLFTISYWLPVWFQGVKNASPVESGAMLLPTAFAQLLSAAMGGMISTFSIRECHICRTRIS
jgi:MFS family permease